MEMIFGLIVIGILVVYVLPLIAKFLWFLIKMAAIALPIVFVIAFITG